MQRTLRNVRYRHGGFIMKYILSVIAVCLVLITAKLYIPEANAEVGGMNQFDLRRDYDFRQAVKHIVEYEMSVPDKNEVENMILQEIKTDTWVEYAIEDIIEDCNIFIDELTLMGGGFANPTCL